MYNVHLYSSLRTIKIRVKPVSLHILDARMFPHANLKTLKMKKNQIILPIENFGLGYKILPQRIHYQKMGRDRFI